MMLETIDFNKEKEILDKVFNRFGHEVFTPGLLRTTALYESFKKKFKDNNVKIITIAGTNGKGQTCHTLSHYLVNSNVNVALWTSPHILSIRERFRFNGQDISYYELETCIELGFRKIEDLNFTISFYEFIFYAFLIWVSSKKLDVLILEVGLGGKLDAVNHFDPSLTAITSISRDHQAILGNTYLKILDEKLGITRKGVPLVTAFKLKYLVDAVKTYTQYKQIPYENYDFQQDYFIANENLAKNLYHKVCHKELVENNIQLFKGREEIVNFHGHEFLFIGAHNPDGMREAMNRLKAMDFKTDYILMSFSNRDKRDLVSMLKTVKFHKAKETILHLTNFDHPKAVNKQILEDVIEGPCNNIEKIIDWKSFLNGIKIQTGSKKILVIGSYYFIGEIQCYLLSNS